MRCLVMDIEVSTLPRFVVFRIEVVGKAGSAPDHANLSNPYKANVAEQWFSMRISGSLLLAWRWRSLAVWLPYSASKQGLHGWLSYRSEGHIRPTTSPKTWKNATGTLQSSLLRSLRGETFLVSHARMQVHLGTSNLSSSLSRIQTQNIQNFRWVDDNAAFFCRIASFLFPRCYSPPRDWNSCARKEDFCLEHLWPAEPAAVYRNHFRAQLREIGSTWIIRYRLSQFDQWQEGQCNSHERQSWEIASRRRWTCRWRWKCHSGRRLCYIWRDNSRKAGTWELRSFLLMFPTPWVFREDVPTVCWIMSGRWFPGISLPIRPIMETGHLDVQPTGAAALLQEDG